MTKIDAVSRMASPISMAKLFKMAYDGRDLKPLRAQAIARLQSDLADAAALMDLSVIDQLLGDQSAGLKWQAEALGLQRLYRSSWPASTEALHLLAFMAPGDVGANTPIEFLLEGADVVLHSLYIVPGQGPSQALLRSLPDHDVAIVAACESDRNRPVLHEIQRMIQSWPCAVLNQPAAVSLASREHLFSILQSVPGLRMMTTARIGRAALAQMGAGLKTVGQFLPGAAFPLICRFIDSHAGRALVKLDSPSSIAPYLADHADPEFFISPFVDYRSADGLFRKYRIMWVDGRPFPCHLAISDGWKIWYYNAGMGLSAAKREEEARFMATFGAGFAHRHATALATIAERFGLEYFGIDCAELRDGRLLVFEGGNDLVAHDMDPPRLYPYKSEHIQKLFAAFRDMLNRKSLRARSPYEPEFFRPRGYRSIPA